MLTLGWEMTPARNARLLLALGKVQAEGGREVSLARFNAALLQVLEGLLGRLSAATCQARQG